jgi:hypothetical protein
VAKSPVEHSFRFPPAVHRRYDAKSYCQILWMTAASGGRLFHPIDKPYPGDDLRQQR